MWYVYILQSFKSKTLYIGVTSDLKKRLKEHNSQRGGFYSKCHSPYKVIFYEAFINKNDAYKAEKFFKTGYGREILNDKLENYFKINKPPSSSG